MRLDSGIVDAGADVRRSVYEMNDSLFEGPLGDGGACDESVAFAVGVEPPGDAFPERVCRG